MSNYRRRIQKMTCPQLVRAMIVRGDLSPAAAQMDPGEAIWQWQESNALSDHVACVELARYGVVVRRV